MKETEARVLLQGHSYLALARLHEAVANAEDETTLFRRVCDVAVEQGGFIGAWIVTQDLDGDLHSAASAGPLAARLAGASGAGSSIEDLVGEQVREARRSGLSAAGGTVFALTEGEPSFTDDFATDNLANAHRAEELGVRSAAALPLRSRGRTVASLSLCSDRAGVFDEDLRELLVGAAENISHALDRFQADADLARALSQRTELLRRLVNVQERERARIAADVHDEPVQALAAVDLRLALLERRLAEAAPDLVTEVVRIHETITTVSEGLRDLLFELEPIGASSHLTDLLEDAATHIFELSPVDWKIENAPDPRELDLSVATRTQAVRIAKEALVNVAKHAQAQKVRILVTVDEDGVTVEVGDDGVGLPPGMRSSPPGHRGISGMLDRAEVSGGSLSVDSDATGTTVSVWLPRV